MKFIKKILDIFTPGGDESNQNDGKLTNSRLLDELTTHFKAKLNEESVGKRMLYPMSFNILMEPSDYNNRKQSFPFVLPEVVASFYDVIEEMKQKYPDYTPPAKYWYFQFSACQIGEISTDGETPLIVRKGHITTVATLTTFDIRDVRNVSVENDVRVSLKLDDSQTNSDSNVNWEAIKTLDVLSEGSYIYKFDKTLNRDLLNITEESNMMEIDGLAELSYSKGGLNYHFSMMDNLIHISGKNEKRKGRQFFILESPGILDSHVQIKYLPPEKKFQIAAFGPARLNSKKIEESSGGDIHWYELANNSSIFINNEISVKFEIKKH